ncbi:hypothetical protein [Halomicrococcus sp. SG-WS-1]|uniref:hypothetical protein n=1 Tax=Halomicrococcus sp. SG-WS-1 TaxID=3439057 RepID=UPI003F7B2C1B
MNEAFGMPRESRQDIEAGNGLQFLEDPYTKKSRIRVSEDDIQSLSPQMGSTKRQKLADATENNSFKILSGELNERALLDQMYNQMATRVSAELGPFVYDQFTQAQPIVYAAVLQLVKEKRDGGGNIQSHADANTSSDFVIEPILPQSFGGSPSDYEFTPSNTGEFDLAPGFGSAASNSTYSVPSDEQSMVLFGVETTKNPEVLQSVSIGQNDGVGGRMPEIVGKQLGSGSQHHVETSNVYWIEDGADVKVSGIATSTNAIEWPLLGVNIVNYDNAIRHGTLESSF